MMLLAPLRRGLGHGAGHRVGARRETRVLEHSHRAVPHDGPGLGDDLAETLAGCRSDVQSFRAVRDIVLGVGLRILNVDDRLAFFVQFPGLDRRGDDIVRREQKLDIARLGLFQRGPGQSTLSGSESDLPTLQPWASLKV